MVNSFPSIAQVIMPVERAPRAHTSSRFCRSETAPWHACGRGRGDRGGTRCGAEGTARRPPLACRERWAPGLRGSRPPRGTTVLGSPSGGGVEASEPEGERDRAQPERVRERSEPKKDLQQLLAG